MTPGSLHSKLTPLSSKRIAARPNRAMLAMRCAFTCIRTSARPLISHSPIVLGFTSPCCLSCTPAGQSERIRWCYCLGGSTAHVPNRAHGSPHSEPRSKPSRCNVANGSRAFNMRKLPELKSELEARITFMGPCSGVCILRICVDLVLLGCSISH